MMLACQSGTLVSDLFKLPTPPPPLPPPPLPSPPLPLPLLQPATQLPPPHCTSVPQTADQRRPAPPPPLPSPPLLPHRSGPPFSSPPPQPLSSAGSHRGSCASRATPEGVASARLHHCQAGSDRTRASDRARAHQLEFACGQRPPGGCRLKPHNLRGRSGLYRRLEVASAIGTCAKLAVLK